MENIPVDYGVHKFFFIIKRKNPAVYWVGSGFV